jgi:hypothetical protein
VDMAGSLVSFELARAITSLQVAQLSPTRTVSTVLNNIPYYLSSPCLPAPAQPPPHPPGLTSQTGAHTV